MRARIEVFYTKTSKTFSDMHVRNQVGHTYFPAATPGIAGHASRPRRINCHPDMKSGEKSAPEPRDIRAGERGRPMFLASASLEK